TRRRSSSRISGSTSVARLTRKLSASLSTSGRSFMAIAILPPEGAHALAQVLRDRRGLERSEIDHAHGPRRAHAPLSRDASGERQLERAAAETRDPQVHVEVLAQSARTHELRGDRQTRHSQVSRHHEIPAERAFDARLEPVLERAAEQVEEA